LICCATDTSGFYFQIWFDIIYRLLENDETWDLIQRVAANPEGGRLKQTYYHIVELAAFIIKVGGLLIILQLQSGGSPWQWLQFPGWY
jgi:hypothetical protein